MNWYLKVLKQYKDFSTRARRREYWMFFLISMIISFFLAWFDKLLGTDHMISSYGILYFIYKLAILIPATAVTVRRLHDVGESGFMLFVGLIPVVGTIWILILLIKDSKGDNAYGVSPKTVTSKI